MRTVSLCATVTLNLRIKRALVSRRDWAASKSGTGTVSAVLQL